jgi:hypothetical protein
LRRFLEWLFSWKRIADGVTLRKLRLRVLGGEGSRGAFGPEMYRADSCHQPSSSKAITPDFSCAISHIPADKSKP